MPLAFDAGRRLLAPTFVAVFAAIAAFSSSRDIMAQDYDSDLDHHMYFGQRLLAGELIWVTEIYDKFPVIQYFFIVPAYFKSIQIWFIISAIILIASAGILFGCLWGYFQESGRDHRYNFGVHFSLILVSFYLFLSATTPPGLAHINSVTTSLMVISLATAARSAFSVSFARPRKLFFLYIISTATAALSFSIRPFMVGLALPLMLLIIFAPAIHPREFVPARRVITFLIQRRELLIISCKKYATWWIVTFGFFVIFNFAPYLITGNTIAMVQGVIHNSHKLNPQSPIAILEDQLKSFSYGGAGYFLVLAATTPWMMVAARRLKAGYTRCAGSGTVLLGVLLPFAGLEAMILARHWWGGYWQMFTVIGVIHFAVVYVLAIRAQVVTIDVSVKAMRIIAASALAIGAVLGANANQEARHAQASRFQEIADYLTQRRALGLPEDFLDIGDMYPHWQLNQPRNGFPHVQNMQHIILGWYQSLPRMTHLEFPYTREELCRQVNTRGPSVVFMQFSYMFSCLLSKESNYILERNSPELIIFVRSSS
jgi:hypothetical protein